MSIRNEFESLKSQASLLLYEDCVRGPATFEFTPFYYNHVYVH
jgi:hypothetical protein